MVGERPADGRVRDDGDAVGIQFVHRADARQQEQVRGRDRAGGEHDFPREHDLAAWQLDADGPVAVERDPARARAAAHREVRPVEHRKEVLLRGVAADAVDHRLGHGPDAARLIAVLVRLEREARGRRRGGEGVRGRMVRPGAAHGDRPARAVPLPRHVEVGLGLREQAQGAVDAPGGSAGLRPAREVDAARSEEGAAVDGARAAEDPAADEVVFPGRHMAARGRREPRAVRPSERVAGHRGADRRAVTRHRGERVDRLGGGPGLEEQHPPAGIVAEPGRDDGAGRSAADDDDVPQGLGHAAPAVRVGPVRGSSTTVPSGPGPCPNTSLTSSKASRISPVRSASASASQCS